MLTATHVSALVALILTGAIFGFFYAYVCSAMWGLDMADPRVAIPAMQNINAAVQNAAFFPTFFLTPLALALAALLAHQSGQSAGWFAAAALVYLIGGMGLTIAMNVPMNEALAQITVPDDIDAARAIWADYTPGWQLWNLIRTIASGVALLLAGIGLIRLS